MIELKRKDKVILVAAGVAALVLLLLGNLSIAGNIGMSITIFSVLFIFAVSRFTNLTIRNDIKNKLKEMGQAEVKTYLKEQGFNENEISLLLKLSKRDD